MQDQLFNFSFEFAVIGSDISESFILIFFEKTINFQDPPDLLFLGFNNLFKTVDFVGVVLFEIALTGRVIVALLGELVFIESSEFFNALVVSDIVLLEFDSHFALFAGQSVQLVLVLFSCFSQPAAQIVHFVLPFLQLITQPFEFGLMQVLEFFFIFAMRPDQVVFGVLVLCFDHVELVVFLVFDFLDLVFQERNLLYYTQLPLHSISRSPV